MGMVNRGKNLRKEGRTGYISKSCLPKSAKFSHPLSDIERGTWRISMLVLNINATLKSSYFWGNKRFTHCKMIIINVMMGGED